MSKSYTLPAKRIAILVHNNVLVDARVRKEAGSLVRLGHRVEVFGFSRGDQSYPEIIEGGATLKILNEQDLSPYLGIALNLFKWIKGALRSPFGKAVFIAAIVAALALLFYVSTPLAAIVLALAAAALLFKSALRAWAIMNFAYTTLANALAAQVIGKGYDAVHCHDIIALMAGAKIKSAEPGIRLIWDAHEFYTDMSHVSTYQSQLIRALIQRASAKIDGLITISASFAEFYAQEYPKLPKAVVVMNATRRPVTKTLDRGRLRAAAGVRAGQKILLFQGGLAHGRGISILLRAAPNSPPDWSLVFMGSGPLSGAIERAAASLNPARQSDAPCIALIPPAPHQDLQDWTSGADLGVIPYENTSRNHLYCTPNKLWEYPNAGVPILATDLVEMSKIITQHDIGLLLPRDFGPDDITAALRSATPKRLDHWRQNCLRFSQTENWETYEPALAQVYA